MREVGLEKRCTRRLAEGDESRVGGVGVAGSLYSTSDLSLAAAGLADYCTERLATDCRPMDCWRSCSDRVALDFSKPC